MSASKKPRAEWEIGAWLALDLLSLVPQTDQVLRQRGALMAELATLPPKETLQ